MGLFTFVKKFKESRERNKLIAKLKEDLTFAWEPLVEVANEMKLRIKKPEGYKTGRILGKIGGFTFEFEPTESGGGAGVTLISAI